MSDETPHNPPVTAPPPDTVEREYPSPANGGWSSPPTWGTAAPGAAAPGSGGAGGGWNYGYGGLWTPPPEPPRRPPNSGLRVLAVIAVVVLVLVSGGLGAVISNAMHDNSSSPVTSPFIEGTSNNPFGSDPATPDTGGSATSTIASKVSPALVNIYTTIETSAGSGQAAGTGMVISSSGEVLTNNHVIADSSTVRVELVATGKTHTAEVIGYDVKHDVALLQIDNVSDLQSVSFADATRVAIGDSVVAIGNAGGRGGDPTVTSGSVTALDQKVTAGDQGTGKTETLVGMIEISAPIEPGDSGGPLVNSDGQVIGMNTAAAVNGRFSGQNSSTAFAIPINRAIRLAQQIRSGQESANVHIGARGLLGVRVQELTSQGASALGCSVATNAGALVAGAESGSPADDAGMAKCDVIVSVDGKNVATTSDLNEAMFPYHPDERVTVRWIDQSGTSREADLKLIPGPPA